MVPAFDFATPRLRNSWPLLPLLALAALLVASVASPVLAQSTQRAVVGPNVNMLGGPASWDPTTNTVVGDPFLQRQNEPSLAVSSRNVCHILAGANDYRAVDLPQIEDGAGERGDAWLGVFKSLDCGYTWTSTLLPGYPQDRSPVGMASPLKGLAAGADATVRAGTSGMFYMSGIAFNRGDNELGKIFVSRFVDNNNAEAADPIKYLGTFVVDSGTSGQFLDKSWIATDIPRGTGTCLVDGQTIPAGPVYLVYTSFVGGTNNVRSKIMFSKSTDCGATWSNPSKLSERFALNQGTTIAVSPADGTIYIAWRQFANGSGELDSILFTFSRDGGRSFAPTQRILDLSTGVLKPFDQGSTPVTFRTNAYPALAVDAAGRVYVAVAARGIQPLRLGQLLGDARVVLISSTNGMSWTMPRAIDPFPGGGHQIMPALAFAGGKLAVAYYDLRENVAELFEDYVVEGGYREPALRRHSLDLRAAIADPGPAPQFATYSVSGGESAEVSRYIEGLRDRTATVKSPLQFNLPNLPLFSKGRFPFIGDYIDIAGPMYLPDGQGGWRHNTGTTADRPVPVFHVSWADNRDVKRPKNGVWGDFTPRTPGPGGLVCTPGQAGIRDQNIYTAQLRPGLILMAPSNAKRVTGLQRSFVVVAQNSTDQQRTYTLRLSPPADAIASFDQFAGFGVGEPVQALTVIVPRRSSVSRTVFVALLNPPADPAEAPHVIVPVTVQEVSTDTIDTVYLNPDFDNPDFDNPDFDNRELHNPDFDNPDFDNPDFDNFTLNQAVRNPDFDNPDFDNPDFDNPDFDNPDFDNPDFDNPDFDNPDFDNPDFDNPDFDNASLTDITWHVKNLGNTTSAYKANLFLNTPAGGAGHQLVVRRAYPRPTVSQNNSSCVPIETAQNQALVNIVAPRLDSNLRDRNFNDPSRENATFYLAPGEEARVTIRRYCAAGSCGTPFTINDVSLGVVAQAANCYVCSGDGCTPGDLVAGLSECVLEPEKDIYDPIAPAVAVMPTAPVVATDTQTPDDPLGSERVEFSVRATDNLGVASVACDVLGSTFAPVSSSGDVFTFAATFPVGTTEVTCRATDTSASGPNTAEATFDVVVNDATAPFFDPGQTINTTPDLPAEATGPDGAVVFYDMPVASDPNGGAATVGCGPVSGSTFPIGSTPVNCTATDSSGNTTPPTEIFVVVVRDVTPPAVTLAGSPAITLEAGQAFVEPGASAVDIVDGAVTATVSGTVNTLVPGTYTVSYTATDTRGNTSTVTRLVTIVDTTPPAVAAAPDVVAEASSAAGAVVTYASPGATDIVGGSSTTVCSPASGSTFPLGATVVTCSATDGAGNSASSSFRVTVRDTTPPSIAPVADVVAEGTSAAGATVAYASPVATDLASGSSPATCSPGSGSVFPYGTTTVMCTATDAAGNSASRSFTVTVRDVTIPSSITDSVNPELLWPPDGVMVPVTVSGTAFDGQSGIASIRYSVVDEYRQVEPSGSIAATNGPYSVTFSLLRDRRGNDKDGRHYTITIVAVDRAGNTRAAAPLVVNVHDQSTR